MNLHHKYMFPEVSVILALNALLLYSSFSEVFLKRGQLIILQLTFYSFHFQITTVNKIITELLFNCQGS